MNNVLKVCLPDPSGRPNSFFAMFFPHMVQEVPSQERE